MICVMVPPGGSNDHPCTSQGLHVYEINYYYINLSLNSMSIVYVSQYLCYLVIQ